MSPTPELDERPQVAALRNLLDAAFGVSGVKAHDLGAVPGADGNRGDLPDIYATVQLERTYAPTRRLSAQTSTTGWRVTVLGAGTDPDEARWALVRVSRALEGRSLDVDGRRSTPLRHESSRRVAKDVSRYTGSHVYTYAL